MSGTADIPTAASRRDGQETERSVPERAEPNQPDRSERGNLPSAADQAARRTDGGGPAAGDDAKTATKGDRSPGGAVDKQPPGGGDTPRLPAALGKALEARFDPHAPHSKLEYLVEGVGRFQEAMAKEGILGLVGSAGPLGQAIEKLAEPYLPKTSGEKAAEKTAQESASAGPGPGKAPGDGASGQGQGKADGAAGPGDRNESLLHQPRPIRNGWEAAQEAARHIPLVSDGVQLAENYYAAREAYDRGDYAEAVNQGLQLGAHAAIDVTKVAMGAAMGAELMSDGATGAAGKPVAEAPKAPETPSAAKPPEAPAADAPKAPETPSAAKPPEAPAADAPKPPEADAPKPPPADAPKPPADAPKDSAGPATGDAPAAARPPASGGTPPEAGPREPIPRGMSRNEVQEQHSLARDHPQAVQGLPKQPGADAVDVSNGGKLTTREYVDKKGVTHVERTAEGGTWISLKRLWEDSQTTNESRIRANVSKACERFEEPVKNGESVKTARPADGPVQHFTMKDPQQLVVQVEVPGYDAMSPAEQARLQSVADRELSISATPAGKFDYEWDGTMHGVPVRVVLVEPPPLR